jgi:hypothetical protein
MRRLHKINAGLTRVQGLKGKSMSNQLFNQFRNRSLKIASALLIVAVSSMTLSAATPTDTPVPPPGATAKPHGVSLSPTAHVANSHLHGATTAAPKTKTTGIITGSAKTTTAKAKVKARATHWAFSEWAELHRGLGTIRGEVHGATGSTMTGVRVALRSSKGKVLKASRRHATHTNSNGTFVMKHVRIGSYRVRGTKGKAAGHVGVKVHGGETASAFLKV